METEEVIGIQVQEIPQRSLRMHPIKFALWLFMATVVMLFMSLTSAYLVKRSDGNWLLFQLPWTLYLGSIAIIASSISMQLAFLSAKRNQPMRVKGWVLVTLLLGLLFVGIQISSWRQLVEMGVFLEGHPAGSFVYILIGVHGAHMLSALVFVAVVLFRAMYSRVGSNRIFQMEMCTTYWHFLGGLWLYLFGFLILFR